MTFAQQRDWTPSISLPLFRPSGPVNIAPTGASSHSSGTPILLPSLLLTQRTKIGFGFGDSPSGLASAPPVPLKAFRRELVFGACFLRSLLMVSICVRIALVSCCYKCHF